MSWLTFLEKMFCRAKPRVADNALTRPIMLKDSSVAEAIATPPTIGTNDKKIWNKTKKSKYSLEIKKETTVLSTTPSDP